MSDSDVIDFAGKFNLADLGKRAKARQNGEAVRPAVPEPMVIDDADAADDVPAFEKLSPLPKAGDPYKAYARPEKRSMPTLFVLRADGSVRGFPYGDLYGPDLVPGDAGKGPAVVMRFARYEKVTLAGRNLDTLHSYLGHHRIAWVRELPKGKSPESRDAPVITGVSIVEIER